MKINKDGFAHKIGEYVMYRSSGIYRISDICTETFGALGERTYYVLLSTKDNSSIIYAPVDGRDIDINLRHVLSPEEIDLVIGASEDSENKWVHDPKEREVRYNEMLSSGNSADILWLFKTYTLYRAELEGNRRRLYAGDAKILAAAERAITDEFSFVLGIPGSEVVSYIVDKIERNKSS